jgi:hypothetical protein
LAATALNASVGAFTVANAASTKAFDPDAQPPGQQTVLIEPAGKPRIDQNDRSPANEIVNPVPLSPQLLSATVTLLAVIVVRYRRSMLNWLT